jgi:hypothetical protein
MPQNWAKLQCEAWTDSKFMSLSTEARLLFLWAWTNDKAAICGLYECTVKQMIRGLGHGVAEFPEEDDQERVAMALRELHDAGMVRYDEDNEVLWVINRVKYANVSARAARHMQREVRSCPDSPLVMAFLKKYGAELGFAGALA